jgi:glycosyltransferase involved in cell wall biosynthesis
MLTLARAFVARGCEVALVTVRSEGASRAGLSPSVRVVALDPWLVELPWMRTRRDRWVLAGVPALIGYLRRAQPEVLLATSHANLAAVWARALAGVRVKLVISVNLALSRNATDSKSASPFSGRALARRFFPWADAVIANSRGVAEDVAAVTAIPGERISTIYNPVVTPELHAMMAEPLSHPWFAPGSPPVVLGVGKLRAQKDFSILLKAFARVRARRPARLLILGEGEQRQGLEALVKELGITADVALPGFVANPFPYMVRAAVFALSSAWEGFSNVTGEALACGCPVVSTDCPGGGPAEILDGGTYGPLVPVGDDAALAEAIVSVLAAPPDRETLRARAATFSVERAADRYLEVLLGDR